MLCYVHLQTLADAAGRFFGGGGFLTEGPNLPPFSSLSTDLGHFILKLPNFDIYFLFYVKFLSLFSRFGDQTDFMLLGRAMALNAPLDSPALADLTME